MIKFATVILLAGVFAFAAGMFPGGVTSGAAYACDNCAPESDE